MRGLQWNENADGDESAEKTVPLANLAWLFYGGTWEGKRVKRFGEKEN